MGRPAEHDAQVRDADAPAGNPLWRRLYADRNAWVLLAYAMVGFGALALTLLGVRQALHVYAFCLGLAWVAPLWLLCGLFQDRRKWLVVVASLLVGLLYASRYAIVVVAKPGTGAIGSGQVGP